MEEIEETLAGTAYVPLTRLARLLNTTVYVAAFVALGMMVGTLGPSLYLLSEKWGSGSSASALGMLFTARMVGTVVGTVAGVRVLSLLANQSNKALTLAASVIGLALFLIPYWSAEGLVHVLFVLRGAGVGLVDTVGTGLVMYLWDDASDKALHAMSLAFGAGAAASPLLIAATYSADAPDTPYWIMTIVILPLAVSALLLRSPRQFAAPAGDFRLGSRLPRHYLRLASLTEWIADPRSPRLVDLAATRTVRIGTLLAAIYMLVVGAELAFGSWLPTFALRAGIGSFAAASELAATFWLTLTLGRLCLQPLVAHIKPFYGIAVYIGSATFAALLLIACKPSASALLSVSTLWAGVIVLGLALSGLSPTILSLFALFDVPVTRSTINALVIAAWIGELIIPVAFGHIHTAFEAGLHSAMLILFATLLALVVLLFRSFSHATPSHGWGALSRRSYSTRPDLGVGVDLELRDFLDDDDARSSDPDDDARSDPLHDDGLERSDPLADEPVDAEPPVDTATALAAVRRSMTPPDAPESGWQ